MTTVLINVALLALLLVVVARAAVAWRRPRARIAWLAALVGVVALFTQGTLVPFPVLDGLLGGTNVLKLVQNVLTMVALWLGIQAGTAPADARVHTVHWRFPLLLGGVFAVVFFVAMPTRGPSSFFFIETAVLTSTGAWVYGVTHMAGIALVGALLFRSARASLPSPRLFFRLGAIAIVLGCLSEIVDLTLARFVVPSAVAGVLFDPLFYLGVVVFVVGIFAASRASRAIRLRGESLLARLRHVAQERGVTRSPGFVSGTAAGTPVDARTDTHLHALRVAVEDDAIASASPLTDAQRRLLDDVDTHLTRRTTGTRS